MVRALALSSTVLLAIHALAGCDLVKSGDEGNLELELVSSDRLIPFSFGTPVAAGLSADIKVYVAGASRLPAALNLVQPKDQDIAVVTATGDGRFTIRGKAAGTTKVDLVSASGNDSFDLTVATLSKITLLQPGRALVPLTPPVRVAQGGTAHFPFTLHDSEGHQLIGYGTLPIALAPDTAATAVSNDSTGLFSVSFAETGAVSLTPSVGGDALEVTVVPATDITSLDFAAPDAGATRTVEVGKATVVVVEAANDLAEPIVGLTGLVTVATSTPSLCSVAQSKALGDAVFQVTGKEAGTCEITATLGALSAAASVEVQ